MAIRSRFAVKRIAIIGAGPCGLSAAKYLVAQKAFKEIVVFEQNAEVGGVWNYSSRPTETLHVPQVNPFCPPDPPLAGNAAGSGGCAVPVFPSPMYDFLHTNIPATLMCFSDLAFPAGGPIFPHRQTVQDYLIEYSQDIRHLIKFSTVVKGVQLREDAKSDQWDVVTESASSASGDSRTTTTFDAVVVASGHYSTTFIPDIPKIREFHASHPGVITHAKHYRSAERFRGQKVLVVGNAASGIDIAAQINRTAAKVLLSVHTATPPENLAHIGAEEVPRIEQFLLKGKGVKLEDGRVETDIDSIVFCTGYLFAVPFLEDLQPPLLTDGRRVHGLYKDFIHIKHPTLVFPGLPIKVVPFPVSEGQAAVFAGLWANSLDLPSESEMVRWEEAAAKQRGPSFHVYPKDGDVEYLKELRSWSEKAASGGRGKLPPVWTDNQVWQRHIYAQAKLKFEQTGHVAKSLAELGFEFKPENGGGKDAQEIL